INNRILYLPKPTPEEKIKSFKNAFDKDMDVFIGMVNHSSLLGAYIASNSNGLLLPNITLDTEFEEFEKFHKDKGMNVGIIDSKENALGNLVLCNDKGAIVSKELKGYVKDIAEILDVEVMVMNFEITELVGSAGVSNNKGCLVHPLASDDDIENVKEVLKVNVDVSTINMGDPFVRSGVVANDYGGIFGLNSSGPELMRLTNVLEL
ncbi:MAG: translation initiation factor IF-6, partial [Promethearchaeota archaeon]